MNLDSKHQQEIISILHQHLHDPSYRAFIFGSRVKATNRPFSDVDLGIEGPHPLNPKTLYQIKDALEESNLPFFVDVIDFNTASSEFKHIAKKHISYLNL